MWLNVFKIHTVSNAFVMSCRYDEARSPSKKKFFMSTRLTGLRKGEGETLQVKVLPSYFSPSF